MAVEHRLASVRPLPQEVVVALRDCKYPLKPGELKELEILLTDFGLDGAGWALGVNERQVILVVACPRESTRWIDAMAHATVVRKHDSDHVRLWTFLGAHGRPPDNVLRKYNPDLTVFVPPPLK